GGQYSNALHEPIANRNAEVVVERKSVDRDTSINRSANPNWAGGGQPIPLGPALPTEFELQVEQLRLTPDNYASSDELRTWCKRNRNRCYIPEWLLDAWDIPVDPDIAA